jgi:hypothetical protein
MNVHDLVVLLNIGGAFAAPVPYVVSHGTDGVALGDLNGDGKLDLAVTDDDGVSVLLNTGNGTFASPVTCYPWVSSSSTGKVTVGDVNGDGRPDLVITDIDRGLVSVLLNTGDGTFAAPDHHDVGETPGAAVVRDLDGDGMPDLAVTSKGGVAVLLNTGNGTFAAAARHPAGQEPGSLAAGDVDGDGRPDLAVVARMASTCS